MVKNIKKIMMVMLLLFIAPFGIFGSISVSSNGTNVSVNDNETSVSTNDNNHTINDNETSVSTNETEVSIKDNETSTSSNESEKVESPEKMEVESLENENITTNLDNHQTSILSDNNGAEMRLLQLQRRVDIQVDATGMVLGKITQLGKQSQFNMAALNEKANTLRAVSISISEYNFSNKTADQIASEFVALKQQSINATMEFKALIGNGLSPADKIALRKLINKYKVEKLSIKNPRIEKLKNLFNQKRVIAIANHFNVSPEMIAKFKAGQYTKEQVKNFIKKKYETLTPTQKRNLELRLSEVKNKDKINLLKKRIQFKNSALKKERENRKEFRLKTKEIEIKYKNHIQEREKQFRANLRERELKIRENSKKRLENIKNRNQEQKNLTNIKPINKYANIKPINKYANIKPINNKGNIKSENNEGNIKSENNND